MGLSYVSRFGPQYVTTCDPGCHIPSMCMFTLLYLDLPHISLTSNKKLVHIYMHACVAVGLCLLGVEFRALKLQRSTVLSTSNTYLLYKQYLVVDIIIYLCCGSKGETSYAYMLFISLPYIHI